MLAEDMGRFYADPLGFVMYAYQWGKDPALQVVKLCSPWNLIYDAEYGPDAWACEVLDDIGRQVRVNNFDGRTAVKSIREAIVSGHGIGKSALVAWLVDWIMSTRPNAKGIVTANTAEQLATKTWAEIAKWTKRCITGHWFDVTTGKGAMHMTHKEHPESWRCDAQTCKEENSEAFAGLHAADSTAFYIFDEASAVPDSINDVSEGGLTDGEPMKFAFGNGTRNTGWFKDCFGRFRHRWGTRHIDSRSVQITNKTLLQQWIDDYGIDSDFCKVRLRGMFPSQSAKQFISEKDVDAAFGRELRPDQYNFAAKILTVDPAWEGDDEFVIGLRQGLMFKILRVVEKNDNDIHMANLIMQIEDDEQADAVFIDAGYGTGIVSAGRSLGRDWHLVWFAEAATDPGCINKRMQMWRDARDWLKAGGAIPDDQVLRNDLLSPQTVPRLDGKMQLESKKEMKDRGLPSPGRGDTLALSFAYHVLPKQRHPLLQGGLDRSRVGHDPYGQKIAARARANHVRSRINWAWCRRLALCGNTTTTAQDARRSSPAEAIAGRGEDARSTGRTPAKPKWGCGSRRATAWQHLFDGSARNCAGSVESRQNQFARRVTWKSQPVNNITCDGLRSSKSVAHGLTTIAS